MTLTKQRRRGRPPKDAAGDRVEPLFPGYVFVRLAPGDAESWSRVRGARGAEEVVGTGREPLPVPDEVVDAIMEWSAGSGVIVYREGRPVMAGASTLPGGAGRAREVERLLQQPPPAEERVRVLTRIVGESYRDAPSRPRNVPARVIGIYYARDPHHPERRAGRGREAARGW